MTDPNRVSSRAGDRANVAVATTHRRAAATRHGVMATHTPGVLTDTTADFAFALMMAAARRWPRQPFLRAAASTAGVDMLLGQDVWAPRWPGRRRRIGGAWPAGRAFDMRSSTPTPSPCRGRRAQLAATRVELDELLARPTSSACTCR